VIAVIYLYTPVIIDHEQSKLTSYHSEFLVVRMYLITNVNPNTEMQINIIFFFLETFKN
jgi:hypothetical protein